MSNTQFEVRLVEANGSLVPREEFATKPMSWEMAVSYVRGYSLNMSEADFRQGRMPVPIRVLHDYPIQMLPNGQVVPIHSSLVDPSESYRIDNVNAELRGEHV